MLTFEQDLSSPTGCNNAFNLCPWFGQSRISLDNVILSLDNVMTFLKSSPILDNVAWFRLSTPDYGQFCIFSYISQNIMDNSVPFVNNIELSIIRAILSKRSDIFIWGQIVHNWDIIVRIKYKDYIYYLFQLVGVQKGHNQLSKLKHCQRHNGPRNWLRDLD